MREKISASGIDFAVSGLLAAGCWVGTEGASEVGARCAVTCRELFTDGALYVEPYMRRGVYWGSRYVHAAFM